VNSLVNNILVVIGIVHLCKYIMQIHKIKRMRTSKGVSRSYYMWSIGTYDIWVIIGAVVLRNWLLLIMASLSCLGNASVLCTAIKYAPVSHKKGWKQSLYRIIRRYL
jgi:uncharacterized protein with PQ loop repeat